jgi:hypothetical protein
MSRIGPTQLRAPVAAPESDEQETQSCAVKQTAARRQQKIEELAQELNLLGKIWCKAKHGKESKPTAGKSGRQIFGVEIEEESGALAAMKNQGRTVAARPKSKSKTRNKNSGSALRETKIRASIWLQPARKTAGAEHENQKKISGVTSRRDKNPAARTEVPVSRRKTKPHGRQRTSLERQERNLGAETRVARTENPWARPCRGKPKDSAGTGILDPAR